MRRKNIDWFSHDKKHMSNVSEGEDESRSNYSTYASEDEQEKHPIEKEQRSKNDDSFHGSGSAKSSSFNLLNSTGFKNKKNNFNSPKRCDQFHKTSKKQNFDKPNERHFFSISSFGNTSNNYESSEVFEKSKQMVPEKFSDGQNERSYWNTFSKNSSALPERAEYGNSKNSFVKPSRSFGNRNYGKRYEKSDCFECRSPDQSSKYCLNKNNDYFPNEKMLDSSKYFDEISGTSNINETKCYSEYEKKREEYYMGYNYQNSSSSNEKNNAHKEDPFDKCMDEIARTIKEQEEHLFKHKKEEFSIKNKTNCSDSPPFNSLRSINDCKNWGSNDNAAKMSSNAEEKNDSSSYQTIETRRTVKNENGQVCEEYTYIRFPIVLPPNVKVIAAHMLPIQI